MSTVTKLKIDTDELKHAFPDVDAGLTPLGARVLVQIRTPKLKSKGGILLNPDTQETELWNTQVGRVIALGAVAFKNRETLAPWPEGQWCTPGDFVRVPKYGGDRWQVPIPGREGETALFVLFRDLDVIGHITCDPLAVVAFV